jgi:hypothetical protein
MYTAYTFVSLDDTHTHTHTHKHTGEARTSFFFISLVLGPLNSLLWYVPSSRYVVKLGSYFCFCKNK